MAEPRAVPLPRLRSIVRSELDKLDRPRLQSIAKHHKKDIWTMNRKELDLLMKDIRKEQKKNYRFHQLLRNDQHAYASTTISQYLQPHQRLARGLVSKKAKTEYDRNLSMLETIDLSNTRNILSVITDLLPKMRNLRVLDLTSRIMTTYKDGNKYCLSLNNSLLHLKKLQLLRLRDNYLSIECMRIMRQGLEGLHNLKHLDISENSLSVNHVSEFLSMISHLPRLETLNISRVFRPLAVLNHTILHVPQPFSRLKHLSMNSNIMSFQNFHFLRQMPDLRYLSLSNCRLNDGNIIAVREYMPMNLEVLILDNNPITDASVDILLPCVHLKMLSMKYTRISIPKIQHQNRQTIVYL